MSKKDFLKLEQNKSMKNGILTSAILCYVSAGVTTLLGLFATSIAGISFSPVVLLDAAIILGLGLLIQLKQNFPASVVLLVYGLINTVYMTVKSGTFGGWLILVAGICATYFTYKLNKEYKAFGNPQVPSAFENSGDVEEVKISEEL